MITNFRGVNSEIKWTINSEILYNAFLVAMEEYFEMDRKKNYYQLSKFIEENVSITGKNNNIIAISLNNVRHSLDDEITKFKNIDITKDQIICQFLQIIRNNIDIIIAGMYSSPNTLPSTYWHNIYSNINKNKIVIKNPTVNNNELVQLFKNSVEQFILSLDTELIVPFDDVIDRCYNIKANNINEDNTLFIEISYQPE